MALFERLSEKQIKDKVNFMKRYAGAENSAEGSLVDANSNVTNKNIAIMETEMHKMDNIQINRYLIREKLKGLFPEEPSLPDQYIKDLESHLIYENDETSFKPYCASVTMFPFLLHGTKILGGTSLAPKNLRSFTGSFVNFVYQVASFFSGAIATVEWPLYFDYFAKKTYGPDYLKTHRKDIEQELQGTIYPMNQPAAARGNQSVFWNTSMLDRDYFDWLYGGFRFPDGTKPEYDGTFKEFQMFFMDWFRREREKELLTYPVLTCSVHLNEDGTPADEEFARNISKHAEKGLSFFVYESKTVDSLSSCCFDANQRVLVRNEDGVKLIRIGDFKPMNNLTIFFNGSWVKGSFVKAIPTEKMYKIITSNKKEILCTSNHIFPTMDGDKKAEDITTDDWLMFNDRAYNEGEGSYADGFLIGMYLGDGSIYDRPNCDSVEVTLSLNEEKISKCLPYINGWNLYNGKNNVVFAKTSYKPTAQFIRKWVKGSKCNIKELNMDVCNMSLEFRRGILDGFYATDGGNSNRIYTTSKNLAYQMEAMLTTMGIQTIIDVSDRTAEKVVVRGEEFNRNYPLYCIRWYEPKNKRSMGDVYKITLHGTFFNVSEIQEITNYESPVYCFNMADGKEPYFTLANGVQTHNCRLRNQVTENTFSYTLGAGGISTGSIHVTTLNANRFVQQYPRGEWQGHLQPVIERMHKYLYAHDALIHDFIDAGLLTPYDAGLIDINKQYRTVGVNGLLEASEYETGGTDLDFYTEFLKYIHEQNVKDAKKYNVKFNCELIPAENLGVKNANWDKKDGILVARDCYNSYLFPVEDDSYNVIDKMRLHGEQATKYLDGGSACHLNLEQLLTADQFYNLILVAGKLGTNYWTFNVLMTCCNECGHIDVNTLPKCPKCGSEDVDYATRVIGYLKRITNFSLARQKEAGLRYYNKPKAK